MTVSTNEHERGVADCDGYLRWGDLCGYITFTSAHVIPEALNELNMMRVTRDGVVFDTVCCSLHHSWMKAPSARKNTGERRMKTLLMYRLKQHRLVIGRAQLNGMDSSVMSLMFTLNEESICKMVNFKVLEVKHHANDVPRLNAST